MSSANTTTIITEAQVDGGNQWSPLIGNELHRLLETKLPSSNARETLSHATVDILGQCVPPHESRGRRTGLVVGKVQSGKTLSFTAVAASAHDNGYRMVIVLAGTKRILAEQTRDRLVDDLAIEEGPSRPWRTYHNPAADDAASINGCLQMWDQHGVPPAMRQTVIVTVHKNPSRLEALVRLIEMLYRDRLKSVIIIDDEADQAGLNTEVRKGTRSPTYRSILSLRDALPAHTYLQYTATPQGNLLISLLDLLSPDFAAVLQPGEAYIGGAEMFHGDMDLMEVIPPDDIPDPSDLSAAPPRSLHRAMRLFFIGIADWIASNFAASDNRSMMVHPSQLTNSHEIYAHWVRSRMRLWLQLLNSPDSSDRDRVISEFREAYAELSSTISSIRPFDELVHLLPIAMAKTEIRVVNSNGRIDIPWRQNHAWLLIGGANLDRGFTVEGLTVTYMPRGPGVANADTIQQRGRFFGYKRAYLGYCRVFLDANVASAFKAYIRHELSIHDWLTRSIRDGVSLTELPRRFLIDPVLRPTRAAILSEDVARSHLRSDWFRQLRVVDSVDDCRYNGEVFDRFITDYNVKLRPDEPQALPDQRLPHQRHLIADDVSLHDLYEGLLTNIRIPGSKDVDRWLTALYLIERWLVEHPSDIATIVRMRPGQITRRAVSSRRDGEPLELNNPFQGAHPDTRGAIYPGDMRIRSNRVTLQLHRIDLHEGSADQGPLIEADVPVVAVWLDRPLRQDIITLGDQ